MTPHSTTNLSANGTLSIFRRSVESWSYFSCRIRASMESINPSTSQKFWDEIHMNWAFCHCASICGHQRSRVCLMKFTFFHGDSERQEIWQQRPQFYDNPRYSWSQKGPDSNGCRGVLIQIINGRDLEQQQFPKSDGLWIVSSWFTLDFHAFPLICSVCRAWLCWRVRHTRSPSSQWCVPSQTAGRAWGLENPAKKTKTEGEFQSLNHNNAFFQSRCDACLEKLELIAQFRRVGSRYDPPWTSNTHKSGDDSKSTRLPVVKNVKIAESLGPALKQPNQWHSSLGGLETETLHEEQKTIASYTNGTSHHLITSYDISCCYVPLSGPLDEASP